MLSAGVIDTETAERIRKYYRQQGGNAGNRLIIAFGILGAVLVGLGVILILAHNWDQLSRSLKTLFAFLPLLIGQLLCGWVLLRQEGQVAWRESAAAFLFFAVGASISLISQIYHLPGDVSAYLLTWMLLCLPLVYLLRSSITSLLYLCGITYLAVEAGYWNWNGASVAADWYWLLLLCLLPYYYLLHLAKTMADRRSAFGWSWWTAPIAARPASVCSNPVEYGDVLRCPPGEPVAKAGGGQVLAAYGAGPRTTRP